MRVVTLPLVLPLSVRLRPNFTEQYTFRVDYDDNVRLWLDHALLIDQWDRSENTSYARANLTSTKYHHLVLEYRELRQGALMQLWWSSPHTKLQVRVDSADVPIESGS